MPKLSTSLSYTAYKFSVINAHPLAESVVAKCHLATVVTIFNSNTIEDRDYTCSSYKNGVSSRNAHNDRSSHIQY